MLTGTDASIAKNSTREQTGNLNQRKATTETRIRHRDVSFHSCMQSHDVVIVGAGPAGLAAAIGATKTGLSYQVVEKGALVNSLLHYPTEMVFFTTPELMEIGGLPFVSPHEKPTRQESLRYYRRVTDRYGLDVHLAEPVIGLRRQSDGLFAVTSRPSNEGTEERTARFVVLASGAYDIP